jgi:beta propeller repeat protein
LDYFNEMEVTMKRCLMMLCLSIGVSSVHADWPRIEVCVHPSKQDAPAIDGNLAVWADQRNGTQNTDIYARLLPDVAELAICRAAGHQTQPAVSGQRIVWRDKRNGNQDIYLFDMAANTEMPICTDLANQENPDISGSIIVWEDSRHGNIDIYGYNLDTMTEFPICTNPALQYQPAVWGHIVVWTDQRNGNTDIYGYNLQTQQECVICSDAANQSYPDISGTIVVWQDERNQAVSGRDIYGFDLAGSGEFVICTDLEYQNYPVICGDYVAWRDYRNGPTSGYDIFGFNLKTQMLMQICTVGGDQTFPAISSQYAVWQHGEDIVGAQLPIHSTITVLYPNGGQMLLAGSSATVQWKTAGDPVEEVRIDFSADNGQSWQILANAVVNTGTCEIVLPPEIHSQQCLILVRSAANLDMMDIGDAVFTVFQCAQTLTADLTGDCFVNLADFAVLADQWLTCGNPYDPHWCRQ